LNLSLNSGLMEYNLNEKNFFVIELFKPQFEENGKYNYYLIEKKGLSHKQLLKRLPAGHFCGIKDKNAITKQWFCTLQEMDEIDEENLKVIFEGKSNERLHIGKHKGNKFKIKIELDEREKELMKKIKWKHLICNYFGEQRFNEYFEMKEALELNNYEKALKIFLTKKGKFDSERSKKMKKIIKENWKDWNKILEEELISESGKKELFEFLATGGEFEKAFDFSEKKSLKFVLKAFQSERFNLMLHNEALLKKPNGIKGKILEEEFLLEASKAFKRKLFVKPTEFEQKFNLNGLTRKTFFQLKQFKVKEIDENSCWIEFELPKGSYATVALEFIKQRLAHKPVQRFN
jgi:tRNA pseudouridine13 synthase